MDVQVANMVKAQGTRKRKPCASRLRKHTAPKALENIEQEQGAGPSEPMRKRGRQAECPQPLGGRTSNRLQARQGARGGDFSDSHMFPSDDYCY